MPFSLFGEVPKSFPLHLFLSSQTPYNLNLHAQTCPDRRRAILAAHSGLEVAHVDPPRLTNIATCAGWPDRAEGLTGSQSHARGSLKRPAPAFQSSRAVILRAYAPVNAFARRFGWDLEESFSVFWDYSAFAPLIQGIDQRLYVLLPVNEHHLSRLVREWRDSWGKGPPRNAHQLISLTDFADQYDLNSV